MILPKQNIKKKSSTAPITTNHGANGCPNSEELLVNNSSPVRAYFASAKISANKNITRAITFNKFDSSPIIVDFNS